MASGEVNGLIVKLLALADDLGAQRKAEIVSVVVELSRAAERERAAAIDEINRLRKRAAERGGSYEPPRYIDSDAPPARRSQFPQASATGGNGRVNEARLQALRSASPSNLDYGPDHGRLQRPEDVPSLLRKGSTANAESLLSGRDSSQRRGSGNDFGMSTNKPAPLPTAPRAHLDHRNPLAQPTFPAAKSVTFAPPRAQAACASQNAAEGPAVGFEHFNQDRFLAPQAPPESKNEEQDPMSKLETLSINTQTATSANTEPVRPRVKLPGVPAVTRPLYNPFNPPKHKTNPLQAPSSKTKRKAAPDAAEIMVATKKAKTSAVQAAPSLPKQQASAKSKALVVAPSHMALLPQLSAGSATKYQSSCIACPGNHGKPTCVECITKKKQGCNGEAHCNHCKGKCRYILCDIFRCDDETCTLLHSCQYEIAVKGSGKVRRNVVGHTVKESALTIAERREIMRIRESVAKSVTQPDIKVEGTD